MPRWLRRAVSALGALLALVGAALVVVLGPDSRFTTGPHDIETTGIAVVTAPGSFTWSGLQIDVLAEVPVNKPVFVGLGNDVDVQNYLSKTERLEASSLLTPNSFLPFGTPHRPDVTQIDGKARLPGAPTSLDWWLASSAGLGGASITATLPDQTVSAVILSVGSSNLNGLEVSFAYGIKGGFWKGLGLLALGAGALWLVRVLGRDEEPEYADEDEVVYVYVDDDGVEHELTAEEAAEYEIVDEETIDDELSDDADEEFDPVEDDGDGDEPDPLADKAVEDESVEDEPNGVLPPKRSTFVVDVPTAADFVEPESDSAAEPSEEAPASDRPAEAPEAPEPDEDVTATSAETTDEPDAEPSADSEVEPRVVYVVVDEDGVEHEVSEDELGDYEVVDEEDDA